MKRSAWLWLVISSMLVASLAAETRPQYGGTARVALRESFSSLDPADAKQSNSFARRSVIALVFDTLITLDEAGHPQPALATSWQANSQNQQWRFQIRHGVKFHDGSSLGAEQVSASLRAANPSWNISVDGESVVIQLENSRPRLPSELAQPRNAIAKHNADGTTSGTGPFHVADWQPGKKLTLAAEENCWRGRPYLDAIEIELDKSYRDQMTALDLGKADVIEIPSEQVHRASLEARNLATSAPVELMALSFTRAASSPDEKSVREALALSIERGSIRSVLLQGSGQPAGGLLPTWISGYGFVFPTDADLARARHAREQVRAIPIWTIGYDTSDSLTRVLAERIALNAKDAGLSLQPTAAPNADLRLIRIPLSSPDPWIALASLATSSTSAGNNTPELNGKDNTIESLYAAEQAMLAPQQVIPLFHLPVSYAGASLLKNWSVRADGTLSLADAWIGSRQP